MSMQVDYATVQSKAQAIELVNAGTITPGTLCITTKDSLLFVDNNKNVRDIYKDILMFESLEDANIAISNGEVRDAQTIAIKVDDGYMLYLAQQDAGGNIVLSNTQTSFANETNLTWKEF